MREQIEQRVKELKSEFETGQQRLADLENQAAQLRQTLLRISGAIQVLEEMLAGAEGGEGGATNGGAAGAS
jgi:prefoldin subunit 5